MLKLEIFLSPGVDLETLEQQLAINGVHGMSVTDTLVFGKEVETHEMYRGVEHIVRHAQKVKLEVICDDQAPPRVMSVLSSALGVGVKEDAKVFVTHMGNSLAFI